MMRHPIVTEINKKLFYARDGVVRVFHDADFSVVLFRSDCMLVPEGHPMKMHKNQRLSNLLSPTDIPCGATNQGTPTRGWGAGASAVP
jgi:hypothetical protein